MPRKTNVNEATEDREVELPEAPQVIDAPAPVNPEELRQRMATNVRGEVLNRLVNDPGMGNVSLNDARVFADWVQGLTMMAAEQYHTTLSPTGDSPPDV